MLAWKSALHSANEQRLLIKDLFPIPFVLKYGETKRKYIFTNRRAHH
ncbi:hypothetical protein PM8797T_23434 [Gimesia maris DSM 8797]|nr:hypothetical protein PM8797T_23434 [Gimesia maris DSM 8797]